MFFRYNLPGIVWGLIILLLLGMPGDRLPDTFFINIPHFDKIVHGFLFFIFVLLLVYGFAKQYRYKILFSYPSLSSILTGILYGGITEILQNFLFRGRTGDIFDFAADVTGCVLGTIFFISHKFFLCKKLYSVMSTTYVPLCQSHVDTLKWERQV